MNVDLSIFGTDEAIAAFNELTGEAQKRVLRQGLRKSANIILKEAKSKLSAGKKKTGKRRIEKAFRMDDITNARGEGVEGVNVGNTSYLSLWLERGTKERKTKSGRRFIKQSVPRVTGKVSPLHFLEEATEEKGEEAVAAIADNVNVALEKITKRQFKK